MPIYNFTNTTSDLSSKNEEIYFDPQRRLIVASAEIRGFDYDQADLNHPQMTIIHAGVIRATLDLKPDILTHEYYKKYTMTWDPSIFFSLALHEDKTFHIAIKDEDDDVAGTAFAQVLFIDGYETPLGDKIVWADTGIPITEMRATMSESMVPFNTGGAFPGVLHYYGRLILDTDPSSLNYTEGKKIYWEIDLQSSI